ncbi:MAG: glycosyltransferase, partial [Proteobacteria bacterium]|nr:glycosyltransferase [Pseudomonadota bacterium]
AVAETMSLADAGPLARPRGFSLSRADLRWAEGPVHVAGPDGRDLLGSPLDPTAAETTYSDAASDLARRYAATPAPAAGRRTGGARRSQAVVLRADAPVPPAPVGADRRKRGVAVVIPVHNGGAVAIACLDSVLAAGTDGARIIVVDDGSTDPEVVAAIDALARRKAIRLIRHTRARGFPISANAGIKAAAGRDVVLLNSDTLVPAGWLERLRAAAYSAPDIGTVTPLSNDATIVSYPGQAGTNPVPDQASTERIDAAARQANGLQVVDIPVGVGFCLYLRRDCLNATGLLRADVFAQGYGEENDFCLRARRLGWRHVALTGLYVGHHGGSSFDVTASHLRRRNARILEHLHPGYDALVSRFIRDDPLAEPRRRIDALRWRAASARGQRSVILMTHDQGGGVERCVADSVSAHRAAGRRAIVLRPVERPDGTMAVSVHNGLQRDYPNLVYRMPDELAALRTLLRSTRPVSAEVHHLHNHDAAAMQSLVLGLGVPFDVHVHDYAWFCPRLSLLGAHDRYCGEPDLAECEACVIDHGTYLNEDISVTALRDRSAAFLAQAQSVIAPSEDAATRIGRHFPRLRPSVVFHEDDDAAPVPQAMRRAREPLRVCVVGGIGLHKGYAVLLGCARDAARRGLPLEFVLVGHSIDDERLLATERVFITGRFQPEEAVDLIRAQDADLAFVPSIWPETWCLSLGDVWRAGLRAAAFDIGAPAERIRRTGRGFVLPLGLQPSAINNALLAAARADH